MSAIILSSAWLLICLGYISYNVGWENLLYLLPHEIAAMVLGVISPIFIFIIFSSISKTARNERKGAEEMLRHGDLIKDISGKIDEIAGKTRDNATKGKSRNSSAGWSTLIRRATRTSFSAP